MDVVCQRTIARGLSDLTVHRSVIRTRAAVALAALLLTEALLAAIPERLQVRSIAITEFGPETLV